MTEIASPGSAGETLGASGGWAGGRGQLSPWRSFQMLISQEQGKKEDGIATAGSGQ